jgi:hypothetical protein
MICKRYSAQYKLDMVKKYLDTKEKQPKTTIAEFADENGLSDSTFNDWVVKYKRQGYGFCNITNEIKKLGEVEVIDSTPLSSLTDTDISTVDVPLPANKVRMTYNGATIEFDQSLFERALNVLKSW